MGKCKNRILTANKIDLTNYYNMTRETAVSEITKLLNNDTKKKNKYKKDYKEALCAISLFGISAEELSEAGISYEDLKALGGLVS